MIPSQFPRASRWSLLVPALVLAACTSTDEGSLAPCDLAIETIAPSAALPGEDATVTGRPFTTAYDTAVYLGSTRATVLAVAREGCEAWDDCLEEQDCSGCDDCDACDLLEATCVESITFAVPDMAAGQVAVQVFNRHGESNSLPFEVLALPVDTGAQDTGAQDTGAQDTGARDTGVEDTDTGTGPGPDSAEPDVDSGETGQADTAQPDTIAPAR